MKKSFGLSVSLVAAVLVCMPASASITFDDLVGSEGQVPNGYAGLNWSNFYYLDGVNYDSNPSGYQNGTVSQNNVAFNGWGDWAEFSGGPFDFGGLYLTAAWNDGLNIAIEGYLGGSLVYSQTVTVDTDEPTWVPLNYVNVDTIRFVSSGGTNHGYSGSGTQFAMDNLNVAATTIPAPAAVVLVGLGAGLTGWLRRRRVL